MSHSEHDFHTAVVRLSERAQVTATLRQEEYERVVKNKPQEHWRNVDNRVGILTELVETLLKDQKTLAVHLNQQANDYRPKSTPSPFPMKCLLNYGFTMGPLAK